ncbi:hypothetical protein AB835_08565 [Candidatus Endobugula sertula]|uniref:Methyltransferase type 12 domain-containing protein n=1 Tax=Candidatus Endobugula sertula TaxID=62101 RepID=A0A1D2QPG2_9GAMM|nr:hypothetical protein AB835_08565 [Candidatus Endobugula sertula]
MTSEIKINNSLEEHEVRESSNRQARKTWENKTVGGHRSSASNDTLEYFQQMRDYRYGYETPFIVNTFNFSDLQGKRILEIGVGNGIDAVEMLSNGAIYTGIDITQNHLELTKRFINFSFNKEEQERLLEDVVEGDMLTVDLPGNYDVVYSFGVLHHIAHEADFLNKIHSLLKPNGELRIAVYSKYSFFNIWMIVTWILKNRMKNLLTDWQSNVAENSELGSPVVIKIRTRSEVEKMLKQAGFKVVKYECKGFVQGYLPIIG